MTFANAKKAVTVAGIKNHPSLSYILLCIGGGITIAALYMTRLSASNPDVSWKNGSIPYANERVAPQKQTKFYSPTRNYAKEESPRPEY